jgi:hypothetical protein
MVTYATFTWNKRTAYSGNHSICISDIGNYSFAEWFTSDFIPVFQGTDYIFNAYAKGDFDGKVSLGIWTADANGVVTNHILVPMSFDNATWTLTQTSFHPDINTATVRLALAAENVNPALSTGTICFDYVSFEGFPYTMP